VIVKVLLAAGARVLKRDESDCIPLHSAASTGASEGIQYLVQAGAAPNRCDDSGSAPAVLAPTQEIADIFCTSNYFHLQPSSTKQPAEVQNQLQDARVNDRFHPNTVATACVFLKQAKLMSRAEGD
jgi:ankyrin repeat protein